MRWVMVLMVLSGCVVLFVLASHGVHGWLRPAFVVAGLFFLGAAATIVRRARWS